MAFIEKEKKIQLASTFCHQGQQEPAHLGRQTNCDDVKDYNNQHGDQQSDDRDKIQQKE